MTTLNKLKLATVIDSIDMDASLVRGIVKWHGGWGEFKEISRDLAEHGANTGKSFVWYTDSVKFFKAHAPALKQWLQFCADNCYSYGVGEMMAKWGLLKGYGVEEILVALYTGKGDTRDQVFDVAVKAATEEIARVVTDLVEYS